MPALEICRVIKNDYRAALERMEIGHPEGPFRLCIVDTHGASVSKLSQKDAIGWLRSVGGLGYKQAAKQIKDANQWAVNIQHEFFPP